MGSTLSNDNQDDRSKEVGSTASGQNLTDHEVDLRHNSINEPISSDDLKQKELVIRPEEGEVLVIPSEIFSFEDIDATLVRAGSSLDRLCSKLEVDQITGDLDYLRKLSRHKCKDAIENQVLSYPTPTIDYFPLACNLVSQYYSVPELINLVLQPEGTWERSKGMMRWSPLYVYHIGKEGLEEVIEKLIERETDEPDYPQWELYEHLSLHADYWLRLVSEPLGQQLFKKIYDLKRDQGLYHCLPPELIPRPFIQNLEKRYIGGPISELQETRSVIPVTSQNAYAGTCGKCQGFHYETLINTGFDTFGKAGILRVDGQAIFSLKLIGNPSMVALRSLRTADGKLAVVRGGLYIPPKEIREKFNNFNYKTDEFVTLDLTEPIKVLPMGWIDSVDSHWPENEFQSYKERLSELAESMSD